MAGANHERAHRSAAPSEPPLPHDALAGQLSRWLAAEVISRPRFPCAADLPRVAPIPHNHLGHVLGMDYARAAAAVWGAARSIAELRRDRRVWGPAATAGALGAALVLVALGAALWFPVGPPGVGVAAVVAAGVGLAVYSRRFARRLEEAVGTLKRRIVEDLLAGREGFDATNVFGVAELAQHGDGRIDGRRAPVFVSIAASEPFPGLGRAQRGGVFVCRCKPETPIAGVPAAQDLHRVALGVLRRIATELGGTAGEAVALDGTTLRRDSPWLDAHQRPHLYVDAKPDLLRRVLSADPGASVRLYAGLQLVWPEFSTCASLLVRCFFASGAASFEIVLATLGPPADGLDVLHARVQAYEFAQRLRRGQVAAPPAASDPGPRPSLAARLRALRRWLYTSRAEGALGARGLRDVEPFSEEVERAEEREVSALLGQTREWIGRYTRVPNWRTEASLVATDDVFGAVECRAAVRAAYDRVARALLTEFDALGFDISDYRNDRGQWTIHAEAIDQLVVGERITVEGGRPEAAARPAKGARG